MRNYIALVLISLMAVACAKKQSNKDDKTSDSTVTADKSPQKQSKLTNRFTDDTLVNIYNHQTARDSKGVIQFFSNSNPTYREAAAMAFASIQDTTVVDTLASLLIDKDVEVRKASVYALGQIGKTMQNPAKVQEKLLRAWIKEENKEVKILILEAIGKSATAKGMDYLASLDIRDEGLLYGLALGVYRAGLKGVFKDELTTKMVDLINPSHQERVREMAANHLGRFGRLAELKDVQDKIIQAMASDQHPFVRMNCARALSKINTPEVIASLTNSLKNDENYLVRVNAIRAYRFAYDSVRNAMLDAVNDDNEHVAITASQYMLNNAPESDADTLWKLAKKLKSWKTRANLLTVVNKYAQSNEANSYIKSLYEKSDNVYEKAGLMLALAEKVENYPWLANHLYNSKELLIRSAAITALSKVRSLKAFDKVKADTVKKDFGKIFKYAIESKDVGLVVYGAQALRNPKYNYKNFYRDKSFLQKALNSLKLPLELEGYQELKKTIDVFAGRKIKPTPVGKAKTEVDWATIKDLAQLQKVQLKTSKGDIIFELFVNESPVSVATFVGLVKKKFYDDKAFHRVIANFVAQGGGPRGDGFGGLDYTITSELSSLRYREGYIGLASAGKDTESCQWFITHSPTPHLDGNYTIFAKVVEGMDIVHKLQVGDKIESVSLLESVSQ
ncbi:peptidylprolyl isomerase [uncultured Microscilla sp.]|uniref:peptidylprolyl isomerase n=1 Tax=uncultured Microscilla sp. TaxID=432653 RepID=UPI0026115EB5|nr:peptidylprolyl isomerase [uncultured Microscilla sp.]